MYGFPYFIRNQWIRDISIYSKKNKGHLKESYQISVVKMIFFNTLRKSYYIEGEEEMCTDFFIYYEQMVYGNFDKK